MNVKTSTVELGKEQTMKLAQELGYKYEQESHYCPQATLAALMDVFHFKDDTLFKNPLYLFHYIHPFTLLSL